MKQFSLNQLVQALQWPNATKEKSFGIEQMERGGFRVAVIQWDGDTPSQIDTVELGTDLKDSASLLSSIGYIPGSSPITLLQPRLLSILRWEKLPTSDVDQVAEMMRLRLRNSPFGQEPCYGAYRRIRVDDDGYTHVLAMFARASNVDEAIEDAARYNLRPTRIEIAPFALMRILSEVVHAQDASVVTIHEGVREFFRIVNGEILFSRAAEGEIDLSNFVSESKVAARRQGITTPTNELTLGTTEDYEEKNEAIAIGDLDIPILEHAPSWSHEDVWVIAAAVGAHSETSPEGNLLPHAEQQRFLKRRVFRVAAGVAALSILLFLVLGGLVDYYVQTEESYIARTSESVAQLSEEVGDLDIQTDQLIAMRNALRSVSMPLETVLELYEITPSDVGIIRLNYAAHGGVELQGEAPNFDSVHEFLSALHASTLIGEARLEYSERSQGRDATIVKFRIAAQLAPQAPRS